MVSFEKSIDILLGAEPVEPIFAESIVVPLTADESIVAARGLTRHLDVIYTGVAKNSDHERGLLAVYDFVSEDVERYRRQAGNLAVAINPERASKESKALAAAAITYFIIGQKSHKTGVWLRGNKREERLIDTFNEVKYSDELTFHELSEWVIKQSVRNDRFWRRQLQEARNNRHVTELHVAIDESDHNLAQV